MEIIREEMAKFEKMLIESTKSDLPFIDEATKYIMEGRAKRIRPALVILSSKICGYKGKRSISYAVIVELIHTATLLHDDVIDNARIRRGKPSINRLFGNEPCVLLGDFYYSRAVEIMGKDGDKELIRIISHATSQIAKGEILEILKTGHLDLDEQEYFEIIKKKTAALFSACCEIGASLAKKEKKIRDSLKEFGEKIGFAFQLTDDALDYLSTEKTLGKKVGTDLREKKVTLPLIWTLRVSEEEERKMVREIFKKDRIEKKDFLTVKELIKKRGGFEYTYEVAKSYVEKAKKCVEVFQPSPYLQALLDLATSIIERKN